MSRPPPPPIRRWVQDLTLALERDFRALAPWLDVPEPAWSRRPHPAAWSVAEVLEHVTLTNRYLLLLVDKLHARCRRRLDAGQPAAQEPPDLELLERLATRELRWRHPAHMTPTGAARRDELACALEAQRERCLQVARGLPAGGGSLASARFSVVDARLDLYQYLRVIGLHLARHRRQLERLVPDPGGPPRSPDEPAPGRAGP